MYLYDSPLEAQLHLHELQSMRLACNDVLLLLLLLLPPV
jgi:hypothetical protein